MYVCRCVCYLTFCAPPACGSGSPALCGSRLAPSAFLLFSWLLDPLMLFLHPSRSPPGPGLYILSPRFVSRDREISIHALRVEGDCTVPRLCRPYSAFLSTPSGWRATYEVLCKLAAFLFLSTPSGWRATSYGPCNSATVLHFYPRPPGGGRP